MTLVHKMMLLVKTGFCGSQINTHKLPIVVQKPVIRNVKDKEPITDGRDCLSRAFWLLLIKSMGLLFELHVFHLQNLNNN